MNFGVFGTKKSMKFGIFGRKGTVRNREVSES